MGWNASRSRGCMEYSFCTTGVIPGLVPGIQLSANAGACGTMDRGDKPRDDSYTNFRPVILSRLPK